MPSTPLRDEARPGPAFFAGSCMPLSKSELNRRAYLKRIAKLCPVCKAPRSAHQIASGFEGPCFTCRTSRELDPARRRRAAHARANARWYRRTSTALERGGGIHGKDDPEPPLGMCKGCRFHKAGARGLCDECRRRRRAEYLAGRRRASRATFPPRHGTGAVSPAGDP